MNKKNMLIVLSFIFVIMFSLIIKDYVTKNEKPKIYMIVKVDRPLDNNFWDMIKIGSETAVKEFNCDFTYKGPVNEDDVQSQINIIEDAIKQKPDVIILAADDYNALDSIAKEIKKAKITLITIDSDIDSKLRKSFLGTNNLAAGKEIGNKLANLLNKKGNVAIINFINNSSPAIDREKGFTEEISNFPNVKIVSTQFCDGSVEKSYEITKALLKSDTSIKGIFGANQQSLEGIAKAVKELGKINSVKIVGFDSSYTIISDLENGIIDAIVVQRPYNMGYLSVKSAVDAIKGKVLPSNIYTNFQLITKDNIYTPENEKLLFPF